MRLFEDFVTDKAAEAKSVRALMFVCFKLKLTPSTTGGGIK